MITVRRAQDTQVDFDDVIRRSPYAEAPEALEQLMQFVRSSTVTYVGKVDGQVGAVYGLMPPSILSNRVYLWLITTDSVAEHRFLFIRHSQLVIEKILQDYEFIVGNTVVTDLKAIRWLKWLGAVFTYPAGKLAEFTITRKSYVDRG